LNCWCNFFCLFFIFILKTSILFFLFPIIDRLLVWRVLIFQFWPRNMFWRGGAPSESLIVCLSHLDHGLSHQSLDNVPKCAPYDQSLIMYRIFAFISIFFLSSYSFDLMLLFVCIGVGG
jgi:hypothetical protein